MKGDDKKYIVKFYGRDSNSEQKIEQRMFNNSEDAYDFCSKLGDRFIEQLTLQKPDGYPDADLDLL